jgi:hypothetical protein
MKTMTCIQLGGACEKAFHANSFEEMADLSQQHGKEMFQHKDEAHLKAMQAMGDLMKEPESMQQWFAARKAEFDVLPEDSE